MTNLSLSDNALTGPIPSEIGKAVALQAIDLSRNHLTGDIAWELGKLAELEYLDISNNRFTGVLPASMFLMSSLQHITANHNVFTGFATFGACSDVLISLDLSWNQLRGSFPAGIGKCRGIKKLLLAHNDLGGALPDAVFSTLTALQSLDLSANHLRGAIPAFKEQTEISALDLSSNNLSGNLLALVGHAFQDLRLGHNRLSGPMPPQLATESLRALTVAWNRLSGGLPKEYCSLSSVVILDLSHNALTGQLCEPASLESLTLLDFSFNRFEGPLPQSLMNLESLVSLGLGNNRFTGTIPDCTRPTMLQILDVSHNALSGSLPAWLGRQRTLRWVNLRNNRFTSGLGSLAEATLLRGVDLQGNLWAEPIPRRLAVLQNTGATVAPVPKTLPPPNEEDALSPLDRQVAPPPPSPIRRIPTAGESSVTGTVSDPAGAVVPGATVSAVATDTGLTRSTQTDSSGNYKITLSPGDYRLKTILPGFGVQEMPIKVESDVSLGVDVLMQVGPPGVLVEVSAGPPPQQTWWNTWITKPNVPESNRETTLRPGQQEYSFFMELSAVSGHQEAAEEYSSPLSDELTKRLAKLSDSREESTDLFVRVSVLGRVATLSTRLGSAKRWVSDAWSPQDASSSLVLPVILTKLLPNAIPAKPSDPAMQFRFPRRAGAVQFGIKTTNLEGCGAIIVSIWDDNRLVPLDQLVRTIQVGSKVTCRPTELENETAPSLYSVASHGAKPDAALHVIEFMLDDDWHSTSFMALREPVRGCANYQWDSYATLTRQVLGGDKFKTDLQAAESGSDGAITFATVANDLKETVFSDSNPNRKCGAAAAFEALKGLAQRGDVHLYARVSDDRGGLSVVPLGILSMYQEGGKPLFPHDIRLVQPVPLESMEETECVSDWTFMLTSPLYGVDHPLSPPTSLQGDPRVLQTLDQFKARFLDVSSAGPTGLVLLAHHEDGYLTFKEGQNLVFTGLSRQLGAGSVAILSACKTGNLIWDIALLKQINRQGADAIVTTAFELDPAFGALFASNFSDEAARHRGEPITVEQAFQNALMKTVKDRSGDHIDEVQRGISLELVLAGNPNLKICGAKATENPQPR